MYLCPYILSHENQHLIIHNLYSASDLLILIVKVHLAFFKIRWIHYVSLIQTIKYELHFFWVVLVLGHHKTLIFLSFLQDKMLRASNCVSYSERTVYLAQGKRCFRNVTKGKIWKLWSCIGDAMGINSAVLSMVI